MTDLWTQLKQRKLVQWAVAYVAFSFALLQGIDLVAQPFGWPPSVMRLAILVLAVGFVLAILLAWYHGEQGRQRVSGTELTIITLVLAFGGVLLWFVGRSASPTATPATPVASKPAASTTSASSVARVAVPAATSKAIPAKSIAVLPFENLSEDKNNGYFADGVQDLILTKLADIGELKVISRTSTLQYGTHPRNLRQIGEALGVATVLEGSVQRAGDQVLINVQLINTGTDAHIWAQSYQRKLDDIFGVEGEVAGKIAQALAAKLSPPEARRLASTVSTTDTTARNLYFKANYYVNKSGSEVGTQSYRQAIALYRQAIAIAPDFAEARAALSIAESQLAWWGGGDQPVQPLNADARAQAEKALALAPDLTAAQLAIGYSDYYGRGDYPAALKEFQAVLSQRPNDTDALQSLGFVQRRLGQFEAAIDSFKKAMALDPLNAGRPYNLALTYMALGRYQAAIALLQRSLALDPTNVRAAGYHALAIYYDTADPALVGQASMGESGLQLWLKTRILMFQHRYRDALQTVLALPADSPAFAALLSPKPLLLARIYSAMGLHDQARARYAEALPLAREQVKNVANGAPTSRLFPYFMLAEVEVGIGQVDKGMADVKIALANARRSGDFMYRGFSMLLAAVVYARADRADLAVPLLTDALKAPGTAQFYAPWMMWVDPNWDPIRKAPAFQALLKAYDAGRPPAARRASP